MKVFALLFAVVITVESLTVQERWENFKYDFKKRYQNVAEETRRFRIFQDKLKDIEEHNARYDAGLETYYKGINQFSDKSQDEISKFFGSRNYIHEDTSNWVTRSFKNSVNLPDHVDWREKEGAVFPPLVQSEICNSDYIFAVTGALEAQNFLVNNISVKLSDGELMDCDPTNSNCAGGPSLMSNSYEYVMAKGGLNSIEDYPFRKHPGDCRVVSKKYAKMRYSVKIGESEEELATAVAEVGPISVALYAYWVLDYSGGIYTNLNYVNVPDKILNYKTLVVGYGVENGTKYWLLKGSFGHRWGEKGYFRMRKDVNMCGITLRAQYPVLEPVKDL